MLVSTLVYLPDPWTMALFFPSATLEATIEEMYRCAARGGEDVRAMEFDGKIVPVHACALAVRFPDAVAQWPLYAPNRDTSTPTSPRDAQGSLTAAFVVYSALMCGHIPVRAAHNTLAKLLSWCEEKRPRGMLTFQQNLKAYLVRIRRMANANAAFTL